MRYIIHDISHKTLKLEWNLSNIWRTAFLNTREAVANRITELCNQRGIAINTLANISGVPPSTIYSMLNSKSQNPGVVSIKKLCDGLAISVRDFFDSDLFENLEQEIK